MLFWVHLRSYFDSFVKKCNNKSQYLHNFCHLRGTKNILENMLWNKVCLIQYSASFYCLENLTSMFQISMGTGSSWILCLKFEFLIVPLIFRACWWKVVEKFYPHYCLYLKLYQPWHLWFGILCPVSFSMLRYTPKEPRTPQSISCKMEFLR